MDEFARIREIEQRLGGQWDGVRIGIGDDAAVLEPSTKASVLSVDTAVEGVHFEWTFADANTLGQRAAICALSDLAAMGAAPQAMLCALTLPDWLDDGRLMQLVDGIGEAAREAAAPVIGGNLSLAPITSITITVIGTLDGPALTRSGARVGDGIFVSGPLGGAAMGLHQLLASHAASRPAPHSPMVDRWRNPKARIELGQQLVNVASAAIDISDGLVQDLEHLCRASDLGARVELEQVPLEHGLRDAAKLEDLDPQRLALSGGEDFELLYTAPPDCAIGDVQIGHICEGSGVTVIDDRGKVVEIGTGGYRHFGSDKADKLD